jgi:cytochrome c oxidase subunit 2
LPRLRTLSALAAGGLLPVLVSCKGPFPQSVFQPAGDLAFRIDHLFWLIIWLAAAVFVLVEGLLVYVLIRYRARPGQRPPERVHGNTVLEISWTLAPVVILTVVAVPTIQAILDTEELHPAGALEISVIGHQWWWEYRYPDYGIVSANELHLPVRRPVVLSLTSADVIHSFWIPSLAAKRDVIAGRTNHITFTAESVGTYAGQCAEFCGASHANMGLRAMVDDSAGFAAWVKQQQRPPPAAQDLSEPANAGMEAFKKIRDPASNSCMACHTVQGMSAGVIGPSLSHVGSRTTIAGGTLPNTPDGLARWLKDPPGIKPGSKMPDIGLTDGEIAALIAFLQSMK